MTTTISALRSVEVLVTWSSGRRSVARQLMLLQTVSGGEGPHVRELDSRTDPVRAVVAGVREGVRDRSRSTSKDSAGREHPHRDRRRDHGVAAR